MTEMKQVGDLQIAQDLEFQQDEWRVERIGWVIMALILLLALSGLFGGPGPISQATAGQEGDAILVDYDRFMRFSAPSALTVQIGPQAIQDGQARIWLDRDYLSGLQIQQISPQPDQVDVEPERMFYTFVVGEAGGPVRIIFDVKPDRTGQFTGRLGMEEAEILAFDQWVYP